MDNTTRLTRLIKLLQNFGGVPWSDLEKLLQDDPQAFACIEHLAERIKDAEGWRRTRPLPKDQDRWLVAQGDLGADIFLEKVPPWGLEVIAAGSLEACRAVLTLLKTD